ncbi:MAG: isochorismatase family cysteine hydrolase [bacterium]|nr:isochorismatase family cysteine hydrolase [bacterium]
MLVDFMAPGGTLYCGDAARAIVPRVREELDEARAKGETIVYLCDRHRPDDLEFRMFPPHCVEGTPGAEICPELKPRPSDRIIAKRKFSGFSGTDLDATLREAGVEEIRLVGVCTNICVLYTAADAHMLNYAVTVPADAVASFDEEAHRFALKELGRTLGVQVIPERAGGRKG